MSVEVRRVGHGGRPSLRAAAHRAGGADPVPQVAGGRPGEDLADGDRALTDAVDALVRLDLDAHGDGEIRQHLRRVQRQMNRLDAYRSKCAGALERREIERAGRGREGRAVRDSQERLSEELGLTPSEAKRAGRAGRQRDESCQTTKAHDEGDIRDAHARIITDTLRQVAPEARTAAERRLLRWARRQNPSEFGRNTRRLLHRLNPDAGERSEQQLHDRRYARIGQQPDGTTVLGAGLSGLGGETIQAAIHAFRTPDAAEERRTPEQATADALVAVCEAALRSGAAPKQHGIPPQILVVIDLADLVSGRGSGEAVWTGPIPAREIQRLCQDATITRVLVDARSVPIEVSEGRRTVNSGVWKALLVRDRGCRWPGCDAPPAWCDVAHGAVPHRDDGQLTLSNGLLLCRRHHRKVDNNGWAIKIRGPDISFVAPDGRVVESPSPTAVDCEP